MTRPRLCPTAPPHFRLLIAVSALIGKSPFFTGIDPDNQSLFDGGAGKLPPRYITLG